VPSHDDDHRTEHRTEHRTDDRSMISALMTGFIHRDLGEWDRLRELFHPDATVTIIWFNGLASEFVDASARMGATDLSSKHVIANPRLDFRGDRAVSETNAIAVTENTALGYVCTTHIRFLDRVELREGRWRILGRRSSYDMSYFNVAPTDVDRPSDREHPHEYAALAHLLSRSGFPVKGRYPTRGSQAERAIRADNESWLNGS
jgi:SnoaL-like domain